MQSRGSTSMRPKGGWSASGTQYMQSSTGQYSTQAGEPAQPVQLSTITAMMCGFRLRLFVVPSDFGSCFATLPAAKSSMDGKSTVVATIHLVRMQTKTTDKIIFADLADDVNGRHAILFV